MNARTLAASLVTFAAFASFATAAASAEDDTISSRPANVASAPAVVDACSAVRSDYHTYFAVTFHDAATQPLVAVEVTNALYDPFGTALASVTETFSGTYSPNVPIEDDGLTSTGPKMPIVRTESDVQGAREDVCSVTAVKFADGRIWRAEPARP